jgi:hypothetical protein
MPRLLWCVILDAGSSRLNPIVSETGAVGKSQVGAKPIQTANQHWLPEKRCSHEIRQSCFFPRVLRISAVLGSLVSF